jgi:hypothetical protein
MHCFSSVYQVITPLHASGVAAARHQEVQCIYVTNGTCYTSEMIIIGLQPDGSHLRSVTSTICHIYVVCLKRSVNGTRKQTKQKIQTN